MGLFSKSKDEKKEITVEEKMFGGKVRCIIVLEIVGRPVDYIKKAMKLVLEGLEKEKGVEITSKKNHKAKKIQSVFSTFTEVEMIVDNLKRLIEVAFDYMPSSIEVIEPSHLKLDLNDTNNLINDFVMKLHKVSTVTKRLGMENEILRKQLADLKK